MQPEFQSTRFELLRELGRGGMGVVYEAYDHEIDSVVALKTLQTGDGDALYRFKKEFRALADIQHPNLVRFGELLCERKQWFFTMDLIHGQNFFDFVRVARPSSTAAQQADVEATRTVLTVQLRKGDLRGELSPPAPDAARSYDEDKLRGAAGQLASALHTFHRSGRVHRDVKPSNVLVREDGHLFLLDFGLVEFGFLDELAAREANGHEGWIMGTPAFMAPEQVDKARVGPEADWYAFGVMLFHALTGTLPFRGPPELVLHIKRTVDAPEPRDLLDVPGDLDELCRLLLRRNPADRPSGEQILARFGVDPEPEVASRVRQTTDTRPVFVGRDRELGALSEAFAECKAGHSAFVVVQGEPGVGKSTLVRRFLEQLDASSVILAGRCYEQELVPFKGFDTIIDSLSFYLASLDDERAQELVRSGVRFLASVFPVLRRVSAVDRSVAGDRAVDNPLVVRDQAFQELKRLLAAISEDVRLIIFIDDLQWADKDSLALLEALLRPPDAPVGLFVATLRGTPGADAQATQQLAGLQGLPHAFRFVSLDGLSADEARSLWAQVRGGEAGDAEDTWLRTLLAEAGGHPLFLSELARYARTAERSEKPSGRLLEVLWSRVQRLDEPSRLLMELVATVGAPIRYHALARAAGLDKAECMHLLGALRTEQMVRMNRRGATRLVEAYHDRIRESIMQHLAADEARIQELRLRLGRSMLESTTEETLPSEVFAIVQQLNLASALITAPAERRRLAELNLLAGREAKLATAYDAALDYLERGIARLDGDPWRSSYELCRDLHLERMQVEYLTGQLEPGRRHFEELLPRMATESEIADLYVSKIMMDNAGGRYLDSIASAREVLTRFGVVLPARPGMATVLAEYAALRWTLRGRAPHELAHLAEATDVATQCALKVLCAVSPTLYLTSKETLAWAVLRGARLSLKNGLCHDSPFAFAILGVFLTGALGKHQEAYELGQLALRLNERRGDVSLTARIYFTSACFLVPWVRSLAECEQHAQHAREAGARSGDFVYECYAAGLLALYAYHGGADLQDTHTRSEHARQLCVRRQHAEVIGVSEAIARFCGALRGLNDDPLTLACDRSSDADFRHTLDDASTSTALYLYHFLKAELAYLFGVDTQAEALLAQARERADRVLSMAVSVDLALLEVLVAARRHGRATFVERRRLDRSMRLQVRKLCRWAASCPQNFEAHWLLAEGEVARTRGEHARALARHADALRSARDHKSPKRAALALELSARLLSGLGRLEEAAAHRRQAIEAYRAWGAEAKADALASEWRDHGEPPDAAALRGRWPRD